MDILSFLENNGSLIEPNKERRKKLIENVWKSFSNSKFLKEDAFYFVDNKEDTEIKIINLILSQNEDVKNKIGNKIKYSSNFIRNLKVEYIHEIFDDVNIISYDELFDAFLLEILITCFYWAENVGNEKIEEKCFMNLFAILEIYSVSKNVYSNNDINFTQLSSTKMINLVMDCYWVIWTFIVSHEIGHFYLEHSDAKISTEEKEYQADEFAYSILINLIEKQSNQENYANNKEIIEVYENYTYLAPMILLDIFQLINFYKYTGCKFKDKNKKYKYIENRKEKMFDWFNNHCNIEIDTTLGNELYNNFLDVIGKFQKELMEE